MKHKIFSMTLAVLLLVGSITGCSDADNSTITTETSAADDTADISASPAISIETASTSTSVSAITEKWNDEDTDNAWDDSTATHITLTGSTAAISGSGAAVSGGTVTITQAGTYVVTGTLSKGQILVNAAKDDLVRLVLNGVDITAGTNAAIYAAQADKLVLILADGSTNIVADTASYTYADIDKEEPNAAIFSKCDLSINGTGSLTVIGSFNHGIATKDDLVIAGGNITVTAVNCAIRGKDSITVLDGIFDLLSTNGDGLKAVGGTDAEKGWILIKGGTFNITAYHDGIQAYTTLLINDGTFHITTGGGWPGGSLKRGSHAMTNDGVISGTNPNDGSYKGLKADGAIVINGGTFTISSYDDSVHANGDITINGGSLTAESGDDGIHANNTVTINDGIIDIKNSYEGIEGAFINLNGGKISVCSTDDGININSSSGLLTISGGNIYVNAGGDGIDSNGSIVMTGGIVYVDGPTASQDGAIDYAGKFNISGGTLIAAGLSGNQAPSATSEQPIIMLYYTSTQSAGTEISLKSADGTALISYSPEKNYSSVVISSPDMKLNETYTVYSSGSKLCDVTLASNVTSISDTGAAAVGREQGGLGGQDGRNGQSGPGNRQSRP